MGLTVWLLFIHFLGDFAFQTNWMATQKSRSLKALFAHVGTYTAILTLGVAVPAGSQTLLYIGVNGSGHLATDYVTSKVIAHYFAKDNQRLAWVFIGLDQFIHTAILVITADIWL